MIDIDYSIDRIKGQWRPVFFIVLKRVVERGPTFETITRRYGVEIFDNGTIRPHYRMGPNGNHKGSKELYDKLNNMKVEERIEYKDNLLKSFDKINKYKL
jgi:hypothetical protein